MAPPRAVGLVGEPDEQRVAVGVGVHRHAADAGVLAGADDAHRDLAAVGDQDLLQVPSCSGIAHSYSSSADTGLAGRARLVA